MPFSSLFPTAYYVNVRIKNRIFLPHGIFSYSSIDYSILLLLLLLFSLRKKGVDQHPSVVISDLFTKSFRRETPAEAD